MYGNEAVSCIFAFGWFEHSERDIRNLEIIMEWAVVSCSKSVTTAKVLLQQLKIKMVLITSLSVSL
jgi:hypothetical protein